MEINDKVLDDFFDGKLDKEFLNFLKRTLSVTGRTENIDKAFTVGKTMLEAYKEPIERHIYISALILSLLFEFLEYQDFKKQSIEEILTMLQPLS